MCFQNKCQRNELEEIALELLKDGVLCHQVLLLDHLVKDI